MLSVFFILCFCVWSGVFCRLFTVLLFLGSLFEKNFRERTFVFGCRCRSCVFWCCFAYVLLYYLVFRSQSVSKNSLDVRSCVSGFFFLSLVFSPTTSSPFCFFKRDSLGSNRAHPHTHLCCLFLFLLLSRRIYLFTLFWPCVLLFGVFLGVPFWAPHVFGILLVLF